MSFWSFRNTISVSNGSDPDQDRRSVGPDLDPNCLQRLLADEKRRLCDKDYYLSHFITWKLIWFYNYGNNFA